MLQWSRMERYAVTKRQLGFFLALVGLAIMSSLLATDLLGLGEWSGIGPLQQMGLGAGGVVLLIGLVLIRIGNRPA